VSKKSTQWPADKKRLAFDVAPGWWRNKKRLIAHPYQWVIVLPGTWCIVFPLWRTYLSKGQCTYTQIRHNSMMQSYPDQPVWRINLAQTGRRKENGHHVTEMAYDEHSLECPLSLRQVGNISWIGQHCVRKLAAYRLILPLGRMRRNIRYPDKWPVLAQHAEPGARTRMRQNGIVFTCRTAFLHNPYGIGLSRWESARSGSELLRSHGSS
jgi:hypothetical protein